VRPGRRRRRSEDLGLDDNTPFAEAAG